jgi:hypothetical protein
MTLEMFPVVWRHVPVEDARAREVADRHYSRQQPGTRGFVPPGERFVLWHEGARGCAVWAVCLNMDPTGEIRWRNTIFRNEGETLSRALIVEATRATFDLWERRYGKLPQVPLTTEIDIEATAARRSKRHEPGWCYREAGWAEHERVPRSHGRPAKVVLTAACLVGYRSGLAA